MLARGSSCQGATWRRPDRLFQSLNLENSARFGAFIEVFSICCERV